MATTSFTIYSHYDPAQREQLERETGQRPPKELEIDPAEAWEVEAQIAFPRRQLPPPRFVPAGDFAVSPPKPRLRPAPASDVAVWYRSLTETAPISAPSVSASAPAPPPPPIPRLSERRSKNNWFIMNAITAQSEPAPPVGVPSTLADILAREPPPLPHEVKYKPPVFLALGPANKGFTMLQNSGWSEGEPLGPDFARRPSARDIASQDMIATLSGNPMETMVKVEALDGPTGNRKGTVVPTEIIDLTMSDSESEESGVDEQNIDNASIGGHAGPSRKALITPISTVLKSDRLGIGLKAKTIGPYKASQKRITHNAAAMAAHVKAAEALRKQKKLTGRGHRGFARQRKIEEANRRNLLAYMNT
ncbi:hypothetical protein K438DRAFT_326864 [Mycena galopus ATCC 62051]|nr:hypothetical protein K438DRAFT_326864 [Mycena galopus ATCC 62051]